MHRGEAAWLDGQLARLSSRDLSPMLNVGSSTTHFRTVRQPWIDERIFAPLRARGVDVKHLDMKADDGVDLTGDLMDPSFVAGLTAYGFRSILCSNVLEHVPDRHALSRRLQGLLPPGGYLVVTVPRRFPYHPDPIDTGFRPDVHELSGLFPELEVVAGEEVDCGTYGDALTHGWRELIARLVWLGLPFVRWRGWIGNVCRFGWIGRRFSATCVILRRPLRGRAG